MYGKIVDGKLVVAGNKIQLKNGWITNPTEQQLIAQGYKEVVYDDISQYEYNDEEEKLVEVYGETETRIDVAYDIVALTDEEHNAIIQVEIVAEENKITPRNIRNAIKGDNFALNKITEVENNIVELRAKIREITNEE